LSADLTVLTLKDPSQESRHECPPTLPPTARGRYWSWCSSWQLLVLVLKDLLEVFVLAAAFVRLVIVRLTARYCTYMATQELKAAVLDLIKGKY
jgi:hypothetical protein